MTKTAAIIQALAAILACYRGYWVFGLSLGIWLPVMFTWSPWSPAWEASIWLWCAVPFTLLQAMATIEAFYSFAKGFWWTVRASVALVLFSCAAMLYILMRPADSFLGQVVQVAKYERVGAAVFLILAVALCAAIVDRPSTLVTTPKGRHLLLLAVYMLTWLVPAAMETPNALWFISWPELVNHYGQLHSLNNQAWQMVSDSWVIIRAAILAMWIIAALARQSASPDGPAYACVCRDENGCPLGSPTGTCTPR